MSRNLRLSLYLCLFFCSTPLLAKDYWIDVRTPTEFAAGHLKGAVDIPYDQIGERINEVTQDKDATIHLYCRSGHRAGIAKKTLDAMGFTHTINEGGYPDLKKSYPSE